MVFGKQSLWLLARFFKFIIMAHLPLHRMCVKGRRLQQVSKTIVLNDPAAGEGE
jgi:hypothetical protein